MKKVLILASVASMIDQFNMPNIELLQNMGYNVDVACNFKEGNTCSDEKIEELKSTLKKMNIQCFQIDFARDVTNMGRNIKSLWQVEQLLETNKYEFLHCHSPIGGVVGRVAGKLKHVKVIYTAHGFHFYKGAPKKNWLIYYPIEKLCSYMTDVLITINKEDYVLAQKKMKAKRVEYVPGVGLDLSKFNHSERSRCEKRDELGIKDSDTVLLSVGELNENKNHETVIKALAQLSGEKPLDSVKYLICGQGEKKDTLGKLAEELGLKDIVRFLGFRTDISEIYNAADVFVFPSFREGLSVALMEAMCCGLPVLCSNIRGNIDLIDENGGELFNPYSVKECEEKIQKFLDTDLCSKGQYNTNKIKQFALEVVNGRMKHIYRTT